MSDLELVTAIKLRDVLQGGVRVGQSVSAMGGHALALRDVLTTQPLNLVRLGEALDAWTAALDPMIADSAAFAGAIDQLWKEHQDGEAEAIECSRMN